MQLAVRPLRSYFDGQRLAVDAQGLVPHPGEALTVVLSAQHPDLSRCDSEYAADYDNLVPTARLTGRTVPETPRPLPPARLAETVAELDAAIATEYLARRPAGWPASAPVAAGPVQQVVIGVLSGARPSHHELFIFQHARWVMSCPTEGYVGRHGQRRSPLYGFCGPNMTTSAPPAAAPGRVPVEHRLLGLDRRTLPFAAVALAVWLLWAVVVPWIDGRVSFTEETVAGDVLEVTEDGVVFTPVPGWGLVEGLRTTEPTRSGLITQEVVLSADGIVFAVQQGPWSGTPEQLLDQLDDVPTIGTAGDSDVRLTGTPTTITGVDGDIGVSQGFATSRSDGLAAAYVFGDEGVLIEVLGASEQLAQRSQEVTDMIASFRDEEAA